MRNFVNHRVAALMARQSENAVLDAPRAQALQEAIFNSVRFYYEYLDRHGLFFDVQNGRVRASALHVICDMCGTEIILGMAQSVRAPAPIRGPEFWGLDPSRDEAEDFLIGDNFLTRFAARACPEMTGSPREHVASIAETSIAYTTVAVESPVQGSDTALQARTRSAGDQKITSPQPADTLARSPEIASLHGRAAAENSGVNCLWPRWTDPLDFLQVPIAEAVARVNAAGYFVLNCNGDVYKLDPDGGVTLQSPGGLNNVFACRYAIDNEGGLIPAGTAWRRSSERCEYSQLGYWPNNYNRPAKSYNLWQGWGVEPQQGDWSTIRDHIRNVIANGNKDKTDYILDWCAHMVQRPWEKPGVALVLKGRKGTGKTLFTELLAHVIGRQNTLITDDGKQLFAKFNWHLAGKVLIGAEEAFFAGDRKLNDRLKHLLTGGDIELEQKFGHCIRMKSMHRMIMTSNHANVIEMAEDERRFFALDVSDKRRGDDTYFLPLWRVANGDDDATLAAFMHELKTRDITNWRPEHAARHAAAALHRARENLVELLRRRAMAQM